MEWTYSLLLLPAVPLAVGDFRRREVAVAWLGVLFVAAAAVAGSNGGWDMLWLHTAVNTSLLLSGAAFMALWACLRRRPIRTFFARSLGAGDAAMLLALTPLFAPAAYVRFVLAACLAALGWWTVKRPGTIPLAGFMALTLAAYAVLKICGIWW